MWGKTVHIHGVHVGAAGPRVRRFGAGRFENRNETAILGETGGARVAVVGVA